MFLFLVVGREAVCEGLGCPPGSVVAKWPQLQEMAAADHQYPPLPT